MAKTCTFFKRKSLEYLEEWENSRTFVGVIREIKTSVTSQALFVPGRSLNRCKIKIPLPVAASRGTVKLLKAVNLKEVRQR